jgi:hypothetical protein
VTAKILGSPPLARQADGSLKNTIGTAFPDDGAVISGRGIHAMLKLDYQDQLQKERAQQGLPPLTNEEQRARLERAVDLIIREDSVFIRPEPERMGLAFATDELLQQIPVPKMRIRFLGVMEPAVRDAIKRRGELWRINPLPHTADEMRRMIASARCTLNSGTYYYYSMETGTRFLTCREFDRIGSLSPPQLGLALREIREHANRRNKSDHPEISFFKADARFDVASLESLNLEGIENEPERLRALYEELKTRFNNSVADEFRNDDPNNDHWRIAMVQELLGYGTGKASEEILMGLGAEFHLRVQWLPGARLEQGELIYDTVFDEAGSDPKAAAICDEKVRSIIFNLLRQHEHKLDYLNLARVPESLSKREEEKQEEKKREKTPPTENKGRRDVYVAELQEAGSPYEHVYVIRMQKWDVREHLMEDREKNLLRAMLMSQEYTEYCLDRHLGCRQLGMALMPIATGTVTEHWGSQMLRSTYFQRDYVFGLATDKLPPSRYAEPEFTPTLARLLGEAAAPNLIVGRCDSNGRVLFDDGDEVLIYDERGKLASLIVADSSGSFADYKRDLSETLPAYRKTVIGRKKVVASLPIFAELYVHHFVLRLEWLKDQYQQHQRAFRSLFRHRKYDEKGCFAYRWEKVLDRLEKVEPRRLGDQLRAAIKEGM